MDKKTVLDKELHQKISLNIISSRGHDEVELPPTEALRRIKEEVDSNGKWVYFDGQHINPDSLSVNDLYEVGDITLTNALAGGVN